MIEIDEELHNLYFSSSIIRIIKSRRMRFAGHVAQMGEKRNAYRKARRKETTGKEWIGLIWLRIGTSGGLL
jgi:hypothetical protein